MLSNRRVVTGLDRAGRSCVIIDDNGGIVDGERMTTTLLWQTDRAPASNQGNEDAATEPSSFRFPRGGSKFVIARFPPSEALTSHGMHASNTLDYGIVVSGRIILVLESGEVELNAGDIIIDRGVLHGWRNLWQEDAVILWTVLDAEPVGAGATV
jgi:quercetin dioxygenase-like cupin family protein